MSLVLTSVIGANKVRIDYSVTPPVEVRQNFLATFQVGWGQQVGFAEVSQILGLPWVASTSHQPTEIVLECRYDDIVMSNVQTWDELINAVIEAFNAAQ